MLDEIEPLPGISAFDYPPSIPAMARVGDFRAARKEGRPDSTPDQRQGQQHTARPGDEVVLSVVAQVSLLEQEGMSVSAIASDLGLTQATVLDDLGIAAGISRPLLGDG